MGKERMVACGRGNLGRHIATGIEFGIGFMWRKTGFERATLWCTPKARGLDGRLGFVVLNNHTEQGIIEDIGKECTSGCMVETGIRYKTSPAKPQNNCIESKRFVGFQL